MSLIPTRATYTDSQSQSQSQVAAYQVPGPLKFGPGPDIKRDDNGIYYVWTGAAWQPVFATDWVVGAGKVGANLTNTNFQARFTAVAVGSVAVTP